jgi:hypothetical protein
VQDRSLVFRGMGEAGSRRAEGPLPVSRRLVSAGADREKARARFPRSQWKALRTTNALERKLGVCADGRRVVLDLRLAGVESDSTQPEAAPRLRAASARTASSRRRSHWCGAAAVFRITDVAS